MKQQYMNTEKIILLMDRPNKIQMNPVTLFKVCAGLVSAVLITFALVSCKVHGQSTVGMETVSVLPIYYGKLVHNNIIGENAILSISELNITKK